MDSTKRRRREILVQIALVLVALVVFCIFSMAILGALDTGVIERHRRRDIVLAETPIWFWLHLSIAFLLALGSALFAIVISLDLLFWRHKRDALERRIEQQDFLTDRARRRPFEQD